MGRSKGDADKVHTDGPWIAVSLRFLQSRACAELSPHALKMLVDLMSMLAPNGGRNGDIWPSATALQARGWRSDASRAAALQELRDAGLVATTRRRIGRRCELIALTLWPLACNQKKLDVMRHHYSTTDYRGHGDALLTPPTTEKPAVWRKGRPVDEKDRKMTSRHGIEKRLQSPQREREERPEGLMEPAAGTITAKVPA